MTIRVITHIIDESDNPVQADMIRSVWDDSGGGEMYPKSPIKKINLSARYFISPRCCVMGVCAPVGKLFNQS